MHLQVVLLVWFLPFTLLTAVIEPAIVYFKTFISEHGYVLGRSSVQVSPNDLLVATFLDLYKDFELHAFLTVTNSNGTVRKKRR